MSEFKGTPGPWERDQFGNVVHGPIDNWGRKENVRVSGVTLPGKVTPEDEANTQLVAAAPELFEALQVCAGYLGELDHNSPIYIALMDKVNDAIEKALGQQPLTGEEDGVD